MTLLRAVVLAALLAPPLGAAAAPPTAPASGTPAPRGTAPAAKAATYSGHGAAKRENLVIVFGHTLAFLKQHLSP